MYVDINIYTRVFYYSTSRFPKLSQVLRHYIGHPIFLENCMPYITTLWVRPFMTETTSKIWGKYGTRFSKLKGLLCTLECDYNSQLEDEIEVLAHNFTVVIQSILDWFPQVYTCYNGVNIYICNGVYRECLAFIRLFSSLLHLGHLIDH